MADQVHRDDQSMSEMKVFSKYLDAVDMIELGIKDMRIDDDEVFILIKSLFPSLRYYTT